MSLKPGGVRRLEKGLWVRVMRGMCPDGFIVAVKGAVLGTESGSALVRWWRRLWGNRWRGRNSWGEEMGEWEVDSCLGVNRRSLCVLPTKICDQLSVSVSQGGIMETLWVGV